MDNILFLIIIFTFIISFFTMSHEVVKKYNNAYQDLSLKFYDFLNEINIYDIKDIRWASHIIFDKNENRFILYESINNETV